MVWSNSWPHPVSEILAVPTEHTDESAGASALPFILCITHFVRTEHRRACQWKISVDRRQKKITLQLICGRRRRHYFFNGDWKEERKPVLSSEKNKGYICGFLPDELLGFPFSFSKITWSRFLPCVGWQRQAVTLKFDHLIVTCACTSFMSCDGRAKNSLGM